MATIGFIGGGNMAEALIKGILSVKLYKPKDIFVSDIKPERLQHLTKEYKVAVADNAQLAAKVEVLVLSIKPQNMTDALESIKGSLKKDSLVVSIAAGKKIASIANILGDRPVVRVMPNTPALIGEGISTLFANDKAKPMLEKVKSIFASVGRVVVLDNEELMDAVTAVSGSGPAYYFLFCEELIKVAIQLGLPENIAKELVLQTAKGAVLLACDADKHGKSLELLRRNVTSPGGTTEAALKVLADSGFEQLVASAVKRAREKSRQLSA
jgi:pyrroline-5-carboxylate reductase